MCLQGCCTRLSHLLHSTGFSWMKGKGLGRGKKINHTVETQMDFGRDEPTVSSALTALFHRFGLKWNAAGEKYIQDVCLFSSTCMVNASEGCVFRPVFPWALIQTKSAQGKASVSKQNRRSNTHTNLSSSLHTLPGTLTRNLAFLEAASQHMASQHTLEELSKWQCPDLICTGAKHEPISFQCSPCLSLCCGVQENENVEHS